VIERLPRGIRLPPAGRALLPEARATVLAAERAQRAARGALDLRPASSRSRRCVRLQSGSCRRLCTGYTTAIPGSRSGCTSSRTASSSSRTCAAASVTSPSGPDRATHRTDRTARLGALRRGPRWRDPLWARPATTPVLLEGLADRSWILFPSTHGLSEVVTEACAGAGFSPRPGRLHPAGRSCRPACRSRRRRALVPDTVVPAELQPHVRHLKRPLLRELTAYTRSEWSPPRAPSSKSSAG
jgi:DNA-binding transcriptional LysR family regulator